MEGSQFQLNPQLVAKIAQLQQQNHYRSLIRPEQIPGLASVSQQDKPKYFNGVRGFWEELTNTPPEEQRHRDVLVKLQGFTRQIVQQQKNYTANQNQSQQQQGANPAQPQNPPAQPQQPQPASQQPQQQPQQQPGQQQNPAARQGQPTQQSGQPNSSQAQLQEMTEQVRGAIMKQAAARTFYPPVGLDDKQAEAFQKEARLRWVEKKIQFEMGKHQFGRLTAFIQQCKAEKKEVPADLMTRHAQYKDNATKAKNFLDDFERQQNENKQKHEAAGSSGGATGAQQPASQQTGRSAPQSAQMSTNAAATPQQASQPQQQYNQAQAEQMRKQREQLQQQQQQQQQKMQGQQPQQSQPQAATTTAATAAAVSTPTAQKQAGSGDGTPTQPQSNMSHPGQPQNFGQRTSISGQSGLPQAAQQPQAAPAQGPPGPSQPYTHPSAAIAQAAANRAFTQQGQQGQPAQPAAAAQPQPPPSAQQQTMPTPQSATSQTHGPSIGGQQAQRPDTDRKFPITKNPNFSAPSPVPMAQARPTLGAGGPQGVMNQPAIPKHPQFTLQGTGDHVLDKKKLDELVRQVMGPSADEQGLRPEVEESILMLADEFVDNVIISACRLAKLRDSNTLELRDIQLILERQYNIRIPGHSIDELRTVKKTQPSASYLQKMNAVQAAKVMGGKTEL